MIMKLQIEFDGDMMLTQVRHLLKIMSSISICYKFF